MAAGQGIGQLHSEPLVARCHACGFGHAPAQHGLDLDAGRAFLTAQAPLARQRRRAAQNPHAVQGEQLLDRQFGRAVDPLAQFAREAAAAHGFQRVGHVGFGEALLRVALRAAALPEQAHHVVERGMAFLAQGEVQAQGDQGALGVVAHGGVGGVLVRAVVLDPGIAAGIGHALHLAPGGGTHLLDGPVELAQVGGRVDAAGAQQEQVVVVARDALEEPQQAGVVFLRVVVGQQIGRAQALDVPGVEILVADEPEQGGVVVAGAHAGARQGLAAGNQGRAGAVLQSAVAVLHGVEQEQVMVEGSHAGRGLGIGVRGCAAVPEPHFCLADAARIGEQAVCIERGRRLADDETVGNAVGREAPAPEAAQLHGAVGQRVVVRGRIASQAAGIHLLRRQGGGQLPPGRGLGQGQDVGQVGMPLGLHAHGSRVEKAALGIEPGGAHRGIMRIHDIVHLQRHPGPAADLPAVLVECRHRAGAPTLAGRHALHVAGEFAHEVAAGNPDRQHQRLGGRWLRDGERDLKQVRVRLGQGHRIVQGGDSGPGDLRGRGGGCRHGARIPDFPASNGRPWHASRVQKPQEPHAAHGAVGRGLTASPQRPPGSSARPPR